MFENSSWAEHKNRVLAACQDFAFVYADLQPQRASGSDWFETRCPFHEDTRPSFAYHRPTGNWKCHAGCGEGDVFRYLMRSRKTDFRGAVGYLGERLGIEPPAAGHESVPTYDYRDEAGDLLFQVVRFGGKKFRQRRPDGNGGWVWRLDDVRRVLYRLPDLLARPDEPVFIVEGEKDVERLHAAGRLATTNPGGAGKWRTEYAASLKDRDVIILPDNDTPGCLHARDVARSLCETAASVRIVELSDLSNKGDVSDWLAAGHTLAELDTLIAQTPYWRADKGDMARPVIVINGRQERDIIADAWIVLRAVRAQLRLFRQSGALVQIVDDGDGPRILLLDEAAVYGHLVRQADWIKRYPNRDQVARPPRTVPRDLLALPDQNLPALIGIVDAPVFAPEGRLLSTPGYDAATKLWYEPSAGLEGVVVSPNPTEAEVAEATRLLRQELLCDFPLVAESDAAHAMAALLLPFARGLISGCAPIHLIEAPTPGSGKSLLADLISIVARGRPCEVTTITRDEDESRKKITALLVRGSRIVLIDNVRNELDSAQMSAALTAEVWSDRVLGQTRMLELPNRATWLVTANNPKLSIEIARRSVRIRIEPHEERPWERREFMHDPIREWAKAERARLVSAALTLVQNWLSKGRPAPDERLGSFESWSTVIGGILKGAGVHGFLEGREDFYAAADTDGQEWKALVEAWDARYGCTPVTASELVALAEENDLLASVLGEKSDTSKRARLGKALARQRDRRFGGRRIEVVPDAHTKTARYRLQPDQELKFDFGGAKDGLREVGAC